MDNTDIAKEWFDIADTDLTSADFLQKMRPNITQNLSKFVVCQVVFL